MPGTVLLLAAAPAGKGCLVDAASVLPVLAAVAPTVLSGTDTANVVELADPLEPQAVLTRLRAAAAAQAPLTVFLSGQLQLDRRQHLPHLALARTTPATVRYTGFPWHWIREELRLRAPGSTSILLDLHADTETWEWLRANALDSGRNTTVYGRIAPPPSRRTVAVPTYMKALATILRSGHRPPLDQLHQQVLTRISPEGGVGTDIVLTAHAPAQFPARGAAQVPVQVPVPVSGQALRQAPVQVLPQSPAGGPARLHPQPPAASLAQGQPVSPAASSGEVLPSPAGSTVQLLPQRPSEGSGQLPAQAGAQAPAQVLPQGPAGGGPARVQPQPPAVSLAQGQPVSPAASSGEVLPSPAGSTVQLLPQRPSEGSGQAPAQVQPQQLPQSPGPMPALSPAPNSAPILGQAPAQVLPQEPRESPAEVLGPGPAQVLPHDSEQSPAQLPAQLPAEFLPRSPSESPGQTPVRNPASTLPTPTTPLTPPPMPAHSPAQMQAPSSVPSPAQSLQPSAAQSLPPGPAQRPAQPSTQAPVQPSTQPFARPSAQPLTQPFAGPPAQPPSQPSVGPSAQPRSQPASPPPSQPPTPNDPHAAIATAVESGRHGEAEALAAHYEQVALRAHGPASEEALHWIEVRADLAMLVGDPVRSCRTWLTVASARLSAGQAADTPAVEAAVDRAHHQWGQIKDTAPARELGPVLAELRGRVPGRRQGALENVLQQLQQLQTQS